jgi:hypothetical protein
VPLVAPEKFAVKEARALPASDDFCPADATAD